jgi:hypothetical protein
VRNTGSALVMLRHFENCASSHAFARFNLHMQASWVIYAATKAVAVMTLNSLTWLWCIWMPLWRYCLTWNAKRVNLATNSFHVL